MGAAPLPKQVNCADLKTHLYEDYRTEMPVIEWNGHKLLRISVQAYNSQTDIDLLLEALQTLI
jgi:selenocysteine lyase/cysteine desulfurase